jgi:leucine-zipper-like transcriptional regulator 1
VEFGPEVEIPPPRFYHSADACNGPPPPLAVLRACSLTPPLTGNGHLVIFGGIGSYQSSLGPEESFLWNDIQIFDPISERWLRPHVLNSCRSGIQPPRARHSHLSSVSGDRLFVIGGEDASSFWIGDICVYDLSRRLWVQQLPYTRHCGTYLSVAACAEQRVIIPSEPQRASHLAAEIHGPPPVLLGPLVIPLPSHHYRV